MEPEIDDYATCAGTYATLRLYHPSESPHRVTETLSLSPTNVQQLGERYEASNAMQTTELSGWFLSTRDAVSSYDLSKHLNDLLDKLEGKKPSLDALVRQGWRADVSCMWDSAYGHGGPTFSPAILKRLSDLGIELWLDVYFHGAYDLLRKEKQIWGGR